MYYNALEPDLPVNNSVRDLMRPNSNSGFEAARVRPDLALPKFGDEAQTLVPPVLTADEIGGISPPCVTPLLGLAAHREKTMTASRACRFGTRCGLSGCAFGTSCSPSLRFGYPSEQRWPVVTDAELLDPNFIRDGRNYAAALGMPYRSCLERLTDILRDLRGEFYDTKTGDEVMLDMEPLEAASPFWFRDSLLKPCAFTRQPRVKRQVFEQWRVALTILRAHCPTGMYWGKVANEFTPYVDTKQA